MRKTLVVRWRYGKEHGGDDVRVNPPYLVTEQLDEKAAAFRATPADAWRWWQVDDTLVVERPEPDGLWYGPDTRIYYLLKRGLAIIERPAHPDLDDSWHWYVHLAHIFHDHSRDCWIEKDLFCDLLIDRTCRHTHVIDLDDLADALTIGLVDVNEASDVLHRLQQLVTAVADGAFPFDEIYRAQDACRELGW